MATPGLLRILLPSIHGRLFPGCRAVTHTTSMSPTRGFMSTTRCWDASSGSFPSYGDPEDKLTVNFVNRNGETLTTTAKDGESLLEVVIRHRLNIDGFGACEGTLACSTCHLIFDQQVFEKLNPVADEEMDMLDLAFGLRKTSRLGCQVCMRKDLDGLTVRVPVEVTDARIKSEVGKQSKQ